jgi:hypothetical protein
LLLIDSENSSTTKPPKDAQYQESGDGILLIFARAKNILIFLLPVFLCPLEEISSAKFSNMFLHSIFLFLMQPMVKVEASLWRFQNREDLWPVP